METIKEKLIHAANELAKNNFNYPDYDPSYPIDNTRDALMFLVWDSIPNHIDIESEDIYDLLSDVEDHHVSNCCAAPIIENTDICKDCREHCATVII
jgi:hypothetical protein